MALKDLFRGRLHEGLASVFAPGRKREEALADLQEQLLLADIAMDEVERLTRAVARQAAGRDGREECLALLRRELLALLPAPRHPFAGAARTVVMLVGVNGSGKTTSAAKLARLCQAQGRSVMLAAADTFRAAGSSQLSLWGERLGVPVVGGDRGVDPGSVVFNAVQAWQGRGLDRLVIDTAGRMQSRENLMRELEKLVRIVARIAPGQPAETWLVLDASTGQNALVQAEKFREFSGINGLFLAKLDGTAKGGAVVSIAARLRLPVLFVGGGEGADDLWEFSPGEFVDALLGP